MEEIIELDIKNYEKCNNIWNMEKNIELKEKYYKELVSKNRIIFVYVKDEEYIAEISLVFDKKDEDYTIKDKRICISRIVVKKTLRRNGYGRKLLNFAINYAKKLGYEEISLGVDLDNYAAMKLYVDSGFTKIQYIGEDEDGKYVKLIKKL